MNEEWKRARRRSLNNRELLIAISDNNYDEITRLVNIGVDINCKHQDGYTPLLLAVECTDTKVVQLLVNQGADLNIKNTNNETPLDIAKRMNRSEIINILDSKVNQNVQPPLIDTNKISVAQQYQLTKEIPDIIQSNKHESLINPVHGYIFQLKILMLFLHRGVACKYSFRLGTEIKEAQKFDDLVFEYTEGNTKVYRLLQAKHKLDEKKKITFDKLLSENKGDFSLVKYFQSYRNCKQDEYFKDGIIKDVTICTNIDFDFENLIKFNIKVEKIKEKDDLLDVKSETKQPIRYKFNNSILPMLKIKLQTTKSGTGYQVHDLEIEDFVQHLVFAVNQPNEEELGRILKKEIGKELDFITSENAYNKFLVKMLDWMKDKSKFISYNKGRDLFDEIKKGSFIWYNVQDPVQSFIGRQEKLEHMHKLLQAIKNSMICICGLGGVGKSELVKKYIAVYSQSYDNKIVWINAENYATLDDSFRTLACDKLDISTTNANGSDKKIESLVAEVYQYFSKSKSLFIFDNSEMYHSNADFDSGIDKFLPTLPKHCNKPNIIITSQNQKWPEHVKKIVLDSFTEEEAEMFVSNYLQLELNEQKEYIQKLGKQLQLLPLALQQAVAYIKAQNSEFSKLNKKLQISDYIESFSKHNQELLSFELPSDCDSKYSKTVLSTWNIALDTLKKKENSHALDLLYILAYFLPDNISIELLSNIFEKKEKLLPAIDLLHQYSLISVHYKALSIHRLVQEVTRLKLVESNKEEKVLGDILMKIVWAKKPIVNFKNVDHFLSVWKYVKKHDFILKDLNNAISIIIEVLISSKRSEEAYSMSIENTKLLDQLSSNDNDTQYLRSSSRITNANALVARGKYEKALEEYKNIYESIKTSRWLQLILDVKNNIAHTLEMLNRDTEAFKWHQEVLADCKLYLGEEHPDTWLTRMSIADFLVGEGKYDEALSIQKEILCKQKAHFGNNHTHTLNTKMRIAQILLNKFGKIEEAKKLFEEIYICQMATLSENHPDRLCTRFSMADILAKQQNYDAALKIYEEVYQIQKNCFEVNDPLTLQTRHRIGMINFYKKDYNKALNVLREVLEIKEMNLGKEHSICIDIRDQISSVLFEQQMHSSTNKVNSKPMQSIADPIVAIKKNNLTELKKLIKKGIDINSADKNKGTLLHHAVNSNQPKIIKFLLDNGADVTSVTDKGNTALHIATSKGCLEFVTALLNHVRKDQLKEYIDTKTSKTGSAALHVAAKNGFGAILIYLLSRGATYNLKNNANQSPLDLASNQQVKVPLKKVEEMFEYAESGTKDLYTDLKGCSIVEYLSMINSRNNNGYNLFQIIVTNNHKELANLFQNLRTDQFRSIYADISNLGQVTVYDSHLSETKHTLNQARSLVKVFNVDKMCAFNPNICTIEDMLELIDSNKTSKFIELAKRVIEFHVKLLKKSIEIHTYTVALFEATKRNDFAAVKDLISKGADVRGKDNGGWTALHRAVNMSNEKIVKKLLDEGAKANSTTNLGITPLHIAATKGNSAIVKLLLKSDSSISFMNAQTEAKGSTALHIAAKNNHFDIFEILFKNGANPRIKDKDGKNSGDLITLPEYEE